MQIEFGQNSAPTTTGDPLQAVKRTLRASSGSNTATGSTASGGTWPVADPNGTASAPTQAGQVPGTGTYQTGSRPPGK